MIRVQASAPIYKQSLQMFVSSDVEFTCMVGNESVVIGAMDSFLSPSPLNHRPLQR